MEGSSDGCVHSAKHNDEKCALSDADAELAVSGVGTLSDIAGYSFVHDPGSRACGVALPLVLSSSQLGDEPFLLKLGLLGDRES